MSKIDECLQGVHSARSEAPRPEKVGVADLYPSVGLRPGCTWF